MKKSATRQESAPVRYKAVTVRYELAVGGESVRIARYKLRKRYGNLHTVPHVARTSYVSVRL